MVNQKGELITSNILSATADATFLPFEEMTGFTPQNCDGVFPLNVVVKYETFGKFVPVEAELISDVRFVLRTQYTENDGIRELEHSYLHYEVDIAQSLDPETIVAHNSVIMALTRPFGRPQDRKVKSLPEIFQVLPEAPIPADFPALQGVGYLTRQPSDTSQVLVGDSVMPIQLNHTDMYQHVYTVIYYRLAEHALSALMYDHGLDHGAANFRLVDSVFRKPFLAGDVAAVQVKLELLEDGKNISSVISFRHLKNGVDDASKPHSVVVAIDGVFE
jgi:acyl-CoA thioesterase FadM